MSQNSTLIILPAEIMAHIAYYLHKDILIIKLYSAFPEYRNNAFLPVLKNNYNYFTFSYDLADKLLRYGFRMNLVCDYSGLGLLSNHSYIKNIIGLKIYLYSKTKIMRYSFIKFSNLRVIHTPYSCIDFNIKKLPASLEVYMYYDRNDNTVNKKKYRKTGIRCINYYG